jgi:Fur family ferric uptake transcriptional regulator
MSDTEPVSTQSYAATRDPPEEVAAVVELVIDRLRAGGHRITTARRAIIASLARGDGHPTVEQISADLEARTPGLSLSTYLSHA